MGMGVLLAVTCKINMLAWVVEIEYPMWVEYIFYVLTGIAIGRGTNFLYDLWNKLKEWQGGQVLPAVEVEEAWSCPRKNLIWRSPIGRLK